MHQSNNGTQQREKPRRCPAGWTHHQKYCYYLNTQKKSTWEEAEQDCMEMPGSHLTSVHSQSAMRWLWKFANKKPFWIGLKSSERRPPWSWASGQHWRPSSFKPSYSFLSGASEESCILVRRRKEWTERSCSERHRYICSMML
ncbi:unnamed protein product [Staurois parvus]|uniref:C-type lectin domain-containing protein n=1 Tax=Staurois parvus TaxID=386267 RepID=A0ABN9DLR2_9NEOB|nr:unnamed protein product [Staurois parvus]